MKREIIKEGIKNCEEVKREKINEIHQYVEDFLGSFPFQLSEEQQYAGILIAYDNILKECKKKYSEDNVEKIIIITHLGDELVENLKEIELYDLVKNIYMEGINF